MAGALLINPTDPIANSLGPDLLPALHVKVRNPKADPVPVFFSVPSPDQVVSAFSQVTAVPPGITTLVGNYTVPVGRILYLERVEVSGENIAVFEVRIDGTPNGRKRTWFAGGLNESFEYASPSRMGYTLTAGQVVSVWTTHQRPASANFETRIQGAQVTP